MIDVIPGIGPQKDRKIIEERIRLITPYTQWIQLDFADNTIVPNETFMDFASFKPFSEKLSLDRKSVV